MSLGSTAQIIEQKLAVFDPVFLKIDNESHMHSGPATDSHFKVTMVSMRFSDIRTVARHQLVYGVLKEELAGPVHALSLHLHAPDEWKPETRIPDSPKCLGGSKND